MRIEGFSDKGTCTFNALSHGKAFLWQHCVFVKVESYDRVNAVCIENKLNPKLVPYAARIEADKIVVPTTGTIHLD